MATDTDRTTTVELRADRLVAGDTILVGPRRGTRAVRHVRGVAAINRGPVRPGGGRWVGIDVGDPTGRLVVTADATVEVVR